MGKNSIIKNTTKEKVARPDFGSDSRMMLNMASQIVSRVQLAAQYGKSYGGERDIYEALGYSKDLKFADYYARYERQDIARRVVMAPVGSAWRKKPIITELKDAETTFEKAWMDMQEKSKVFHYLYRSDLISGIGTYGVLFMGFDDGNDMKEPVEKAKELLFLRPYSENSAEIVEWEKDMTNERYGKPLIYRLKPAYADRGDAQDLQVHHSRVIHIAEGSEEDDVYGVPRMRPVFNRLQDIELVAGGSAEMFWRGAFPGMGFTTDADTQWDPTQLSMMQEEIEKYMHDLQRYLRLKGVDIKELKPQVADPSDHIAVLLDLISGATGIPKRILIGSERGELASSQDENNWNSRIEERRLDYVEPSILRPFIDKQIEVGTLPPPTDGYDVEWPPTTSPNAKEEAEVTKIKVEAITKYAATPGADILIPPDFFYKKFLGLSDGEIEQIESLVVELIDSEQKKIEQERLDFEAEQAAQIQGDNDDDDD